MCPSKPTNAAGLYKYTLFFFLFLVFTSISFCNIVCAWSCLLWPTVLLFCLTGKGLACHFLSPLLPLWTVGYSIRISSLFMFDCLDIPLTFAQISSCLFCRASLHLLILFHIVPRYEYFFHLPSLLSVTSTISRSPCCLLSIVSGHLCSMTLVAGKTPPV